MEGIAIPFPMCPTDMKTSTSLCAGSDERPSSIRLHADCYMPIRFANSLCDTFETTRRLRSWHAMTTRHVV